MSRVNGWSATLEPFVDFILDIYTQFLVQAWLSNNKLMQYRF